MYSRVLLAMGVACSLGALNTTGAVLFVDPNSATPTAPYSTWATAASEIQDAIDAATDGDQILVTNGVYQTGGRVVYGALTNRVVINKAVTVQSVNGPAVTTIQGNPVIGDSAVRCVYLTNNASLIGFTLTQGATRDVQGDLFREWTGGGAWCEDTGPLIFNCVFTANSAANGGGGIQGGTLLGCVLGNNTSTQNYGGGNGGGAALSAVLVHCSLLNNSSVGGGGGADSSTLNFCELAGNAAISGNYGGGALRSTLSNCIVTNNVSEGAGAGISASTAYSCDIVGNSAGFGGGGAYACTLNNCIVYYNQSQDNIANYNACELNACCTAPDALGNNFTNAPNFANFANGDLHLQTPSFCINAGDNATVVTDVDWDGNPRIFGTYVDVGAYEYQSAAPSPLAVQDVGAAYFNFATGFKNNLGGLVAGHADSTVWDFGDGTTATNQLNVSHTWSTGGNYNVTLTAYNSDNPGGVRGSVTLHVLTDPVYYVALSNSTPAAPYNSWASAATNIQAAVNAAVPGGTVLVSNGVYNTGSTNVLNPDRVVVGQPITVRSVNGPGVTIIQGSLGTSNGINSVRCVFLGAGATLAGFTLTNGYSVQEGGGVYCTGPTPVVSNCVLIGNSGKLHGGGGFAGSYYNCIISGNRGGDGAGVWSGQLSGCLVISNSAATYGGGIYNGGATNCTFVGNFATNDGGGAIFCSLANCILFNNTTPSGSGSNWISAGGSYCCTMPLMSGTGNISNSPPFVDAPHGNFRLQIGSRCMNAGNNIYASTSTDLDGNPRIVGGTVDMGAYESQSGATIHYVIFPGGIASPPYTNWATAATSIQAAVDVAASNDIIVVDSGTYNFGGAAVFGAETNRVALTNPVTLLSLNGPSATRIVGGPFTRGVYVGTNAVISGFTITNGQTRITGDNIREQSGGGIWCEPSGFVANCIVVSNVAGNANSIATNRMGGGIYGGTISNCIISSNLAGAGGGAAAATVLNCNLSNNVANNGGGAFNARVIASLITSNSTIYNGNSGNGGGLYLCLASNCVVSNNQSGGFAGGSGYGTNFSSLFVSNGAAMGGGGCYLNTNYNCVVRNNFANSTVGGGMFDCTSFNCTVVGNHAEQGGGDYQGVMNNCILYYNTGSGSNYLGSKFNYSSTAPLPPGVNFTNAPVFVNLAAGDLHVLTNSPTINGGTNVYVATATDFDGNPRIVGDTVDIGAYEYQGSNLGLQIPIPWLTQYNLPLNGSGNYADSDGDGINNWQEWIAGTNPKDINSALRVATATADVSGITVTWASVTNRTYFLQRDDNVTTPGTFQTVGTNIAGQVTSTSFLDTSATGPGPYFYRVGVQ